MKFHLFCLYSLAIFSFFDLDIAEWSLFEVVVLVVPLVFIQYTPKALVYETCEFHTFFTERVILIGI